MKMTSATSSSKAQGPLPGVPLAKPGLPPKKASKEPKGDKSLETTVEKLTQSRNKEISEKSEQAQNATAKAEAAAEKEKRLAGPSERKHKEKPPEKKAKEKEKENGENGSPLLTEVAAPADKAKLRDEVAPSGEVRSGENPEKAPAENQNCDGAAAPAKDSPRKDRMEEEVAAKPSSPGRKAAKSKDLGSNDKDGEGVVEGGKWFFC